ncbi:MAG: hypothetical protein HY774_25385 [Acidobacteria bacterium]|nr:hypothetical protein [Acidobacteriota bacterium]
MTSGRRISSRFFGSGFFFIGLILVFGVGNHLVVRETEARSQRLPGIEGSVPVAINPLLTSRTMFPKLGNPLRQTPTIAATKVDALQNDVDVDGAADPGDRLRYTVVITNSGGGNATGVNFTDTIDANTTLVAGSVKVSPLAIADSYNAVGNTTLTVNTASGVRANDYDVDGVTPTASLVVTAGTFSTTAGGSVTLAADGSFTYEPQVGDQNLTDTFTYTLTDGDGLTDTGTVTINLGQRVWYVDSTASAGGNGTFASRFDSLADVTGATGPDTAGDIIYVFERTGDYDGNMTLLGTQQLIGSGVALTVNTITVVAAGSNTTLVATAASTNSITLGSGNTVRGFTIGNTTGAGISGNGIGTFSADTLTINGTGQILNLNNGTINATSGITLSTSSTTSVAVVLTSMAGSVTAGGSISGANGGFSISGTMSLTYSGSVTNGGTNPMVNVASHSTGTIIFQTGTLSSTNNGGFSFDNADGTYNFNGTNTLNGGGARLTIINGSSGSFTFSSNTSITNPNGNAVNINGGAATVNYPGTVSSDTAFSLVSIASNTGGSVTLSGNLSGTGSSTGILVSGNTGGTYTFSGGTKTLNTSANTAVNLSTNTGATINFTGGGLDIDTTTGTGFTATGGGTVTVTTGTNNNTIDSTTGTALNISSTTIGTSGVTFRSISSNGGSNNGIILNTTGSTGGLTVTGDGSTTSVGGNSTGGTIANKSGADLSFATVGCGIYLNNTSNVVLRRMTINGTNQNYGIRGTLVNGFTLEYSTVGGNNGTNFNTAPYNAGEGSIYFGDTSTNGLSGTATLTNNNISGGEWENFRIITTQASPNVLTLSVKGNTFGANLNNGNGNASMTVENRGTGTINTTLGGAGAGEPNTFTSARANLVNFTGQTASTMDVVMRNNIMSNNHPSNNIGGCSLTLATQGVMTFHVTGNTMRDANGSAVTLQKASAGTLLSGFFDSNTIGVAGVTDSGSKTGNGLFFSYAGGGTGSVTITNNQIHQIKGNFHISADNTGGSYTANFDIRGNLFDTPGSGNAGAIGMTNGSPSSSDTVNVCAVIGGSGANKNTISGYTAGAQTIFLGSSGAAAGHTFNLPGLSPTGTEVGVQNFVAANNTMNGTVVDAYADSPATFAAFTGTGTSCSTPVSRPATSQIIEAETSLSAKPLVLAEDKNHKPVHVAKLNETQISWLVEAAIARWIAAGAPVEKIDQLRAVKFGLADLEKGNLLVETPSNLVLLDAKAAGYGWYIDPSPMDDVEFDIG